MEIAMVAGINLAFVLVFSIFVLATMVLLVLTIRFIVKRARADKQAFEAERAASRNDESPPL